MPDALIRPPISPLQPGAYSSLDASALAGDPTLLFPIAAVLGQCAGGAPNTPLYFKDPQALKSILRSGPAYDCARFAFGAGALPLLVMRVGAGILQSSKTLAGASSFPVTLTSIDYGTWNNNIKVAVAANNVVTISYTDPLGVTYQEVYDLGVAATAQQVVDAINGKTAGYPKSNYVTAAVTAGTMPLTVAGSANFSAGADGTLAAGDWTTGLTALETVDCTIVVPATGDATVHAQVQTHCDNMSNPIARKERTGLYGAVLGETVAQQLTRMTSLRNKRSQLVYPGGYEFDDSGNVVLFDPFYMAAKAAGAHVSLDDEATSLTHKAVPGIIDVEKRLSTLQGSDIDQLLRAGVTPIAPTPVGGFWFVDSLSGWNTDETFRDYHKIRTADAVAKRLRTRLETVFVGGKVLDSTAGDIQLEAQTELQKMLDETLIRAFKDVQVQPNPADSRAHNVSAPVVLPDTNKFIFITVALQPASQIQQTAQVSDEALL